MKAEQWEELGRALDMSEEQLEKIGLEEGNNLEKCKQYIINVRGMEYTPLFQLPEILYSNPLKSG